MDKKIAHRGKAQAGQNDKTNDNALCLEYNGMAVSFTGDGWFNATAAAKHFEKRIPHWLENAETQQYMPALAKALNIRDSGDLIRTQRGRDGGTWLHPKLAVAFARWCDVDFAVWCDLQIDHILRGGLSVWRKAGGERSDTADREPLLTAAAAIVARHRLPFGPVYEALNLFAGVTCARDMSCEQVVDASGFAARILAGAASAADFEQVERNRAHLGVASTQLDLLGGVR